MYTYIRYIYIYLSKNRHTHHTRIYRYSHIDRYIIRVYKAYVYVCVHSKGSIIVILRRRRTVGKRRKTFMIFLLLHRFHSGPTLIHKDIYPLLPLSLVVCVCVYVCVYICVCVCVWEKRNESKGSGFSFIWVSPISLAGTIEILKRVSRAEGIGWQLSLSIPIYIKTRRTV